MLTVQDIISWCNSNSGFAQVLLSAFTTLLSIIAVVISIKTSLLPYRKKILLKGGFDYVIASNGISSEPISVSVSAFNVGNREINVRFIGLSYKKKWKIYNIVLLGQHDATGCIEPAHIIETRYDMLGLKEFIAKNNYNGWLYLSVRDSEDMMYLKRWVKGKTMNK